MTMESSLNTRSFSSAASTRGLHSLVGATLIAASMIPVANDKIAQVFPNKNQLIFGWSKQAFAPDTSQFLTTTEASGDAQLLKALASVYESLVRSQMDLDVETRGLLRSKLWDLYD